MEQQLEFGLLIFIVSMALLLILMFYRIITTAKPIKDECIWTYSDQDNKITIYNFGELDITIPFVFSLKHAQKIMENKTIKYVSNEQVTSN